LASVGLVGILMLTAGLLLAGRVGAQNVPEVGEISCDPSPCHSGGASRTESDEGHRASWDAIREARRQRKTDRDAQKEAKRQAQADGERELDETRRQMDAEAARQLQLATEAKRLEAVFFELRPAAVSGLKGVDGALTAPKGAAVDIGLKGIDDAPRGNAPAKPTWDAQITDPQVAPIARRLASIVPPLPISEKDVALDLRKIYLNDNQLLKTTDYVVAGWQMAGLMGKTSALEVEVLLIAGKTLIAGQDGAYMYLARRDKEFDAAAAYLRDPATAQAFAHLVDDVRQNRPLPALADRGMVEAAQAINAHHAGNDIEGKLAIVPIMWDQMTSPEAVSAMLRKASIEGTASIIGHGMEPGVNKLLEDQAQRKAMYDGIRLERNAARKMMDLPATTDAGREQLTTVIKIADQLSADCYKFEKAMDRVVSAANGLALGDATDRLAKVLRGPETKVHEF
jgi:hypothetical protein